MGDPWIPLRVLIVGQVDNFRQLFYIVYCLLMEISAGCGNIVLSNPEGASL